MTDLPLSERRFALTFGHYNQTEPWTDVRLLSWAELSALLTTHRTGGKEGTGIVPAVFRGQDRTLADADRIEVAFLDSDAGATLANIESAIVAKGWAAVVSSTHSHMATQTRVKRSQWGRYVEAAGDGASPAGFLTAEKGYMAQIVEDASIRDPGGEYIFILHQPCPKFRIAIPLLHPWRAADYPDQALANAAWKANIEALAAVLDLNHDQACTDTSRLFFLPRRPRVGPPPETLVLAGSLCDIAALPRTAAPERTARGAQQSTDAADFEFADPDTGEIFDLTAWARRNAASFQIVTALRARQPGVFVGRVADQTRHHIRCANEEEHTQGGVDAATFIVNASDSATKGFVYHCRHAHCVGRDRLFFLRKMLELDWLTIGDLTHPTFHNNRPPQRPIILVTDGALPALVDKAEQALLDADLHLYQRGGVIVRPGRVTATVKADDAPHILEVGDHALREAMMKAADWQRSDGRSKNCQPCDAPMKVATTYRERVGKWRLPVLTGIITAPTLRSDGSILAAPGYDAETGLLFDPGGAQFPAVSARPSRAQAEKALRLLDKLIGTFPFVGAADRSVMLAAILTASVRRSLRTAPLFGFTAPAAGSGKSMLVDLVSIITTGREASVIAQGKTAEEFEKRLGSLLLSGDQVVAIDNCEAPLSSELLCSMLTQQTVRPRILGRSEAPELPCTAVVTVTGNNLVLVGDLTRRSLLCRLDPKAERPELRVFKTDPIAVAKAHRSRLLVAALTVLRAYHVAGYKGEQDALGSFAEWSRRVRGALLWLGRADPVQTMERTRQVDPRRASHIAVLMQWRQVIGLGEVTVREVIAQAEMRKHDAGPAEEGRRNPGLYEAIRLVAGDGTGLNSRRLGNWLADHEGGIAENMRIVRGGLSSGLQRWRVEVFEPDPTQSL